MSDHSSIISELAGLLKKYQGCDVYRCLNLGEEVLRIRRAADRMDVKIKQLEAENAELIEMLKQVYLADDEGSSQFIELQQKVSDCLFNNMGWAGDENKFANWQESVVDDLTDPTQSIGVDK